MFRQDFSCPALLVASLVPQSSFRVRGYHPLWPAFPEHSTNVTAIIAAVPISLATTLGISVDFFSCSYLDVSVRRVRFAHLCIQCVNDPKVGFPHSEIYGSMRVCSLPVAYRKLLRPSSPEIAKASTMCTYSLVPITLASLSRVRCYRVILSMFSVCRILVRSHSKLLEITLIHLLIQSQPTRYCFLQELYSIVSRF